MKINLLALYTSVAFIALLSMEKGRGDDEDNPCVETGVYSGCTPHCISPGSISGARLDPATSTNFVICKGESISIPSILADLGDGVGECNNGINTLVCTDSANYGRDPNSGTAPVTYSLSTWWEPEIPAAFDTPGTFTFTAKAKGVDGPCPDTSEVEAGRITVTAIKADIIGPPDLKAVHSVAMERSATPSSGTWKNWRKASVVAHVEIGSDTGNLVAGDFQFEFQVTVLADYEYETTVCPASGYTVNVGRYGSVSGTLLTPTGIPFGYPGTLVQCFNTYNERLGATSGGSGVWTPDADGTFSASPLRSGPVRIVADYVSGIFYYWGEASTEVEPGEDASGVNLTLNRIDDLP